MRCMTDVLARESVDARLQAIQSVTSLAMVPVPDRADGGEAELARQRAQGVDDAIASLRAVFLEQDRIAAETPKVSGLRRSPKAGTSTGAALTDTPLGTATEGDLAGVTGAYAAFATGGVAGATRSR